ncbi:hypothetical protein D3C86_2071760 [compost metagenome]
MFINRESLSTSSSVSVICASITVCSCSRKSLSALELAIPLICVSGVRAKYSLRVLRLLSRLLICACKCSKAKGFSI